MDNKLKNITKCKNILKFKTRSFTWLFFFTHKTFLPYYDHFPSAKDSWSKQNSEVTKSRFFIEVLWSKQNNLKWNSITFQLMNLCLKIKKGHRLLCLVQSLHTDVMLGCFKRSILKNYRCILINSLTFDLLISKSKEVIYLSYPNCLQEWQENNF